MKHHYTIDSLALGGVFELNLRLGDLKNEGTEDIPEDAPIGRRAGTDRVRVFAPPGVHLFGLLLPVSF